MTTYAELIAGEPDSRTAFAVLASFDDFYVAVEWPRGEAAPTLAANVGRIQEARRIAEITEGATAPGARAFMRVHTVNDARWVMVADKHLPMWQTSYHEKQ